MKKSLLHKNHGITLITLVVAVSIMIIISGLLIYNAKTGIKVRSFNMMKNDIDLLEDKVSAYYMEYGALPVEIKYNVNPLPFESVKNPNDSTDGYYVLDLKAFEGLTLNYGADYDKVTEDTVADYNDYYVINEQSHQIYYVKGIEMDETMYYTNTTSEEVPTIEPVRKEVSVKVESTDYIYDGTEKKPTVQVKFENALLVENRDYTLQYENNKNAGTGTIKINYTLPYYGEDTFYFTITPIEINLWINNQQKTVGSPDPTFTYNYSGDIVEGETPAFTGEFSRKPGETVGSYDITQGTLQLKDSGNFLAKNYTLNVTPGVLMILASPPIIDSTP